MNKSRRLPFWIFLGLFSLGGARAHGDYQKKNQTLELLGGISSSNADLDLRSVGGGQSPLTRDGYALGARYTYYFQSDVIFGIGTEISDAELSHRDEAGLVPTGPSRSDARTTAFLALVKLPYPHGAWRPYVIGGIGVHRTSLSLEATPTTSWADTGTHETRSLFDATASQIAAAYGVGLEWFPDEQIFVGLEARWLHLGAATYGVEPGGRSIGLRDIHGSLDVRTIWFKAGLKFGKILLPDSGGPAQLTRL